MPGPPGTPAIISSSDTTVDLKWTPPTETGGCKITGYFIEKCEVGKDIWVKISRTAIRETNYVVGDLILNAKFKFRVSAENKAGVGPPSDYSESVLIKLPYGKIISISLTISQ